MLVASVCADYTRSAKKNTAAENALRSIEESETRIDRPQASRIGAKTAN